MTALSIPELSLVVLIGPSGSGKSSFARKHFTPTEVVSSDACRGLVADDETALDATTDAFDLVHFITGKRLARGRLTVIDATNVQPEARKLLVALARQYHCLPVAIVFDLPERLCQERNQTRPDRAFGPHVVRRQMEQLRRGLRGLQREGFRHIFVLNSVEAVDAAGITREPLFNNRRQEHGPVDIIGDVHGCYDELTALLTKLGYQPATDSASDDASLPASLFRHPEGRKAIFLGDLVDRGPHILATVGLVRAMTQSGAALCVPGNHDMKLLRKLQGRDVQVTHGMQQSLAELSALPADRRERTEKAVASFLDSLVSHYVLDDGKLVVAHAGMKAEMQGRGSGAVREFALYGETTGETDEFGLPVRYNWAADYRGSALVVYGHTPTPEPEWLNGTINIDTGCVFGGRLTALRYPERELVSVPAAHVYAEPVRPFPPAAEAPLLTAQQTQDDLLDLDDVIGKRLVNTRLMGNVTIPEAQAMAALEVMSRFAVDPKWLLYLPPTMSPPETSALPGLLEHPSEAFSYYRSQGMSQVVCEAKHMGSRAVVIVCRDETVVRRRFGVTADTIGVCYTRTGRRFFDDVGLERAVLATVQGAASESGLWEELTTDWLCLDCELMPWSAKAQDLLRRQYAPVGVAGRATLGNAVTVLEQATTRVTGAGPLYDRYRERAALLDRYVAAYRHYCWLVTSLTDLKLAPFHLLASEGAVHVDKDHRWHVQTLNRLCRAGEPLLFATSAIDVDVTDPASQEAGVHWWEALTAAGGEGMVVKPLPFAPRGVRRLIQPAVKCRGPEYLRLIYGPEYSLPEHLERLRTRRLGAKRSLALREFALGIEALERFVRREPLRRVHECVFGVLALESEPVDPRL